MSNRFPSPLPGPRKDAPGWAAPSRRARLAAAALAVGLAALTAVIVSLAWKRPPHPAAARQPIEVKLIPSTPAPAR